MSRYSEDKSVSSDSIPVEASIGALTLAAASASAHPPVDDSLLHDHDAQINHDITKSRAEDALNAYAQAQALAEASLYAYVEAYNKYNSQLKAFKDHIAQAISAKPESAEELQGVYEAAMAKMLSAKPEGFDDFLSHALDSYVRAEEEASLAYYAKAKAEFDVSVTNALLYAASAKSEDVAETYKASAMIIAHSDWITAAKAELEANAEERLDIINHLLPKTESLHILSKVEAAVDKAWASAWARDSKLAKAEVPEDEAMIDRAEVPEDEAMIDRAEAHASDTDSVEGEAQVMDDAALAAAVDSALTGLSGHHEDDQDFFA